ncbi:MAG: beta-N-acetylhexosaminidase [Colwellia sp.]|nr:beta-N-acetylhexosaminidase [Colwellia sp.]MCW8863494.1 beta-N-acetylhexosaminidase [Colwellia sp.]MCW9079928.1 beta-N-acetylhexosaminidase [Colwellia sp.]
MRYYSLLFAFFIYCLSFSAWASPIVIPAFSQWQAGVGTFTLNADARLVISNDKLKATASQFQQDLKLIRGIALPIVIGKPQVNDLYFTLDEKKAEQLGNEGYQLKINDSVQVSAAGIQGVYYGMQSLLQLFKQQATIARGQALDKPSSPERGIMMDVAAFYLTLDELKAMIRQLSWNKMNFLHLHLADNVAFRLKSDLFPGLTSKRHYSKADIRELQDYAAQHHVMIIPEIDIPSHATHILKYNPYLAFECPSMRTSHKVIENFSEDKHPPRVLDITRREVREWTKAMLAEWLPLFDAPYFHIGGDEYPYDVNKYACPELMQATKDKGYPYPGDVFVEYTNELNAFVKSFGKITQIWNWWRFSPDENKKDVLIKRINQTSIQPDKDIIVNIWNQPRQDAILQEGYQAIITSEEGPEALYVTPGDGTLKPGDYGYFDSENIHQTWQPRRHPTVQGFKICIWALDDNGLRKFDWLKRQYDTPLSVVAQKSWGSKTSAKFTDFKQKISTVGHSIRQ